MDRLHSMRVFSRVIDAGSFTGAARELKLSPAVVTRLVADLEDHLGARLINRTTRRLALTETGEIYLGRVRQILAEVEDAESQASAANAQPRGHLRVQVPGAFAAHALAPLLPAFRAQCPLVTLELVLARPADGADERYDVSIVGSGARPVQGDFVVHPLLEGEDIACAAPSYLDRRGRALQPQDLAQHDMLLASAGAELGFQRLAGGGTATVTPLAPRQALVTAHVDTLYAAALAGLGVAVLPSFVVDAALRDQRLERVLPEWRLAVAMVCAAVPRRQHLPARTQAFVDFLRRSFDRRDQ